MFCVSRTKKVKRKTEELGTGTCRPAGVTKICLKLKDRFCVLLFHRSDLLVWLSDHILCWFKTVLFLKLMKPSFVFLDKSVHVADAGIGLPSFCATRGGHSEESSLSNHALHPATGEAGGGDGAWTKTPAHTFTHTECSKLDGIEEVLSLFFLNGWQCKS